jgi:hypothetical protein
LFRVIQLSQHRGGDPLRGWRYRVEVVLQALQDESEPAGLDWGAATMLIGIRHAQPLQNSGARRRRILDGTPSGMMITK